MTTISVLIPLPPSSITSPILRLNEGLLEAEPHYKQYLSEEIAKLQRPEQLP